MSSLTIESPDKAVSHGLSGNKASRLSILVPLYNEEEFVATLLARVLAAPLPDGMGKEIIVVDDGSKDGSAEIVDALAQQHPGTIRLICHAQNQGKGAAIRTAIEHATGEFCVIQDADLEYDPAEYSRLLKPLLEGAADAVFGSRFMIAGERRVQYFWHAVGNRMLTTLSNMFADLDLTDVHSCYKIVRTSLMQSIPLRNDRFAIDPELTIKLSQRHARIYEMPISYYGRTYEEGKKIGLRDAFEALFVVLKAGFTRDIYKDARAENFEALSEAPRFNQWMADTIKPYLGNCTMEIGAGIGNLTRFLVPRRKQYVVTDIDSEHLARLSARFHHRPNVEVCSIDMAECESFTRFAGQMDSVVCLNVLEHIEDDLTGLRNIHRLLRPQGRAVVLVPHGQEIYGAMDVALGHYRRYSEAELREKMESAGFEVEKVIAFNHVARPAWYISGKILKRRTPGRRSVRWFDRFVWLWRRIDSHLPWSSMSLIAIGVKK
jgi:glycosyltransferase involved in cell wall biosynthesis